jgi:hypothetical protein
MNATKMGTALAALGTILIRSTATAQSDTIRKASPVTAQTDTIYGYPNDTTLRRNLVALCEQRIRSELVAPSTAVFNPASDFPPKVIYTKGTFTVFGNVEAMNKMGGRSVTLFTCNVTKNGEQLILGQVIATQM